MGRASPTNKESWATDTSMASDEDFDHQWRDEGDSSKSWLQTHNSIRADMEDFPQAIITLIARVKQGSSVEDWQKAALSTWWKRFLRTMQAQHSFEEEFMFPWLELQAAEEFPYKRLHEDHDVVTACLDQVTRALTASYWSTTRGETLSALERVRKCLQSFQRTCFRHFDEEERVCLHLMKKYFSPEIVGKMLRDIMIRTMTLEDMAQILRPLSKEKRTQFLRQLGISYLRAHTVFLPACKKYERQYTVTLQEICDVKIGRSLRLSISDAPSHTELSAGDLVMRSANSLGHCQAPLGGTAKLERDMSEISSASGSLYKSASSSTVVDEFISEDADASGPPGCATKKKKNKKSMGHVVGMFLSLYEGINHRNQHDNYVI